MHFVEDAAARFDVGRGRRHELAGLLQKPAVAAVRLCRNEAAMDSDELDEPEMTVEEAIAFADSILPERPG